MLNDRLNCFLGRSNGFEGLRECPMGEPLILVFPFMLPKLCFDRGGPMIDTDGLLADCGRLSGGGDSIKHSPRVIDVDVDSLLAPAPKRKGGNWLSGLRGSELVE